MANTVTAVVVTYNRLELLKKLIESLRNQTRKLDNIIIINNSSTDGTEQWLSHQQDLQIITQPNVGGSGGFYRGIKEAFDAGYDYIWAMDDDVAPRQESLAELLEAFGNNPNAGICSPTHFCGQRRELGQVIKFNLSNPFKELHSQPLLEENIENTPIEIEGMTFEGPLIKREVVEKIGLPNRDLFILYDDSDYSYRTVIAGYKVLYVPKAIFDRADLILNISKKELFNRGKWKLKYHIRNCAYFWHRYGKNPFAKYLGSLHEVLQLWGAITFHLFTDQKYNVSDFVMVWSMYKRGVREELGKMS